MTTSRALAAITAGLLVIHTLAQRTYQHTLEWTTSAAQRTAGGSPGPVPGFAGALLDADRGFLPYFHHNYELPVGTTDFAYRLVDPVYEPLSAQDLASIGDLSQVNSEPLVNHHVAYYRQEPVAQVSVYPYRRTGGSGRVERLRSFGLELTPNRSGGPLRSGERSPDHSKLQSGDWFRMTVTEDGVHALTYEQLQSEGVPVSGLASDLINIYGNHEGQLSYLNSELGETDLKLNSIVVEDGGDGQFGPGDRILFYASSAQRWDLLSNGERFVHSKNVYTDSATYFLGIGVDPPQRITDIALSTDPATDQVTAFNDRQFFERDNINMIKSGRTWFGEHYDVVDFYNWVFSVPFLRPQDTITLVVDGMARTLEPNSQTSYSSSFDLIAGSFNTSWSVDGFIDNYASNYAIPFQQVLGFTYDQSTLPITITFNPHDPITSQAWMNYLEMNARRDLKFIGDQLLFRDLTSVQPGAVSEFTVDLAQNVHRIWEITDPTHVGNVSFATSGAQKSFRVATDSLRQFIAFRNGGFPVPVITGRVPNQDLHATAIPTDLVIVCPQAYLSEVQPLVDRRISEGLVVAMVTPEQVFNEFSSGQRDATAIKRYMKLLYDKAGNDPMLMPRYLLLFGDGSYNNWVLADNNQNLVPTYQTKDSWNTSRSYCSDDYFGLLDNNEGEYTGDLVDIGIGRIPASNKLMAKQMVDKILNYDRLILNNAAGGVCATTGDGGANDWRNWVLFVSDDQEGADLEGTVHMVNSDELATGVETDYPDYNVTKIYLDAYQQTSTPGGERYYDAEAALRERVQKGLLLLNYVGHGGEVGWAHERLLDNTTILGWTNKDRLPLWMTATCEFSRWDDPARTAAGEYVLLNPDGGGIGLMTTTRLAYSAQNQAISRFFYDFAFEQFDEQGRTARLGDIYRRTKYAITDSQPGQTNHRSFSLLGDPSVALAMPRLQVLTTAVTDTLGNAVDTLLALSTIRVSGIVADDNGVQIPDFNGVVIPTVFDKSSSVVTLANDGGNPFPFQLRRNVIYRGKATVTGGAFNFTFVVPKDIAYQYGFGRLSYYVESSTTNGNGANNDIVVGGTDNSVVLDENGPRINLFMNDERFVPGGTVNDDPLLLAKLFDENGINTLGNSIGHDMLAILDENTEQSVVLNDLYEADLDTYKSGRVLYRYSDLPEGNHTLRVKAWDVHNNSADAYTEFVVAASEELALAHVLNYPNPFTTRTDFYFEHNRPCSALHAQVQVYTVSGRLVKTLDRQLQCEGTRSEPMTWDGLDDSGDKLGRGVYVYRLNITTPEGESADKFEKLVILR